MQSQISFSRDYCPTMVSNEKTITAAVFVSYFTDKLITVVLYIEEKVWPDSFVLLFVSILIKMFARCPHGRSLIYTQQMK